MKIELILRSLGSKSGPKKCKIKVEMGEYIEFSSAEQVSINGTFSLMEKNTVETQQKQLDYICFSVISNKSVLASKTIFFKEAINVNSLKMQSFDKKSTFQVKYELKVTSSALDDTEQNKFRVQRKMSIEDEPAHLSNAEGKLKLLKLGSLSYNFANRIDPLIYVFCKLVSILTWKKPEQTIILGVILSLLVIFPKIGLCVIILGLNIGKQRIYKKIQQLQSKKDICQRMFPPQENMVFLQNNMQAYCNAFQSLNNFIREDDKSTIVMLVEILCKVAVLFLVLQLLFTSQFLILIAIWLILLSFSPSTPKLFKYIKPYLLEMNQIVDKKVRNVTKGTFKFLNFGESSTYSIVKQFYIYEYDRWWLGKEWVSSHWSDQNRNIVLLARTQAPKDWYWIENWIIDYEGDVDGNGFEYTNDLLKEYSSSKSLKTIRRRKWVRKCERIASIAKIRNRLSIPSSQLLELPSLTSVNSPVKNESKKHLD